MIVRPLLLFPILFSACTAGEPPAPPPPAPVEPAVLREAQADRAGLPVPTVVEGEAGGGDVDVYRIDVPAKARLLRIEASSDGDAVVEVEDAAGRKLARAGVAPAGSPETIENLFQHAPLVVRISVAGKEPAPYRLEVTARPPVRDGEAEPNDGPATALPLPLGKPVTGTIAHEEDEDVWRLELPALPRPPPTLEQAAFAGEPVAPPAAEDRRALRVELSGVPGLRGALALVDAEGTTIAETRGRAENAPVLFRNLAIRPDARLPLAVVVKSGWVGRRRTAAPGQPYRLVATLEPAAADLEEEPNDVAEQATPIPPGSLGRLGFLSPAGDADWFSITVDRPQVARVVVSGVEDVDLVLEVPDPAAGKDAVRLRAAAGGVKEGEFLPGLYLPAGTTYLRIASASRKVDGRWVRDYENAEQTYTLGVTTRDAVPGDEVEPNDVPERAGRLTYETPGRGFLHPWKDVDLWRLDVGVEDEGTLVATVRDLPKVEVALALRGGEPGPDGLPPVVAEGKSEEGLVRLSSWVEPGVWYLEVKSAKTWAMSAADAYRLDVALAE